MLELSNILKENNIELYRVYKDVNNDDFKALVEKYNN